MNSISGQKTTRVKVRTHQLRDAHIDAHILGYETREGKPGREKYEARLMELCGVTSLRRASREQRDRAEKGFALERREAEAAARTAKVREIVTDDDAAGVLLW